MGLLPGLFASGATFAQTEKTVSGQYGQTPYISHAEFQNISVEGRAASGKSSNSKTMFGDILTVASLDEVTRRFGEPNSTEYNRFPEGSSTDYTVVLTYDGLEFKYRKIMGEINLQTMTITSEDRFLKVGGVNLRPGMSTDSLSAGMQKAIEEDGNGLVAIAVAPPGKSGNFRSIRNSETEVQLLTKTGMGGPMVKKISFHRIYFKK